MSSPSDYTEVNNWYNNKSQIQVISAAYQEFLSFSKMKKSVENRCFLIDTQTVMNETASAQIVLMKNGLVLDSNFKPPGTIDFPQKINISWDKISFIANYSQDTVAKHLRVEYFINSTDGDIMERVDKNRIIFPISQNGSTTVSLKNLRSKALYTIKISAGSDVGYGPVTEIAAETSEKEGKFE